MDLTPEDLSSLSRLLKHRAMLGQLALAKELISQDQLNACLEEQRRSPKRPLLGSLLVSYGFLGRRQLEELLKQQKSMDETEPAETAVPFPPGTARTLGHYRLIEVLGEGGMGVVFRARDEQLGREVALKMLKTAQSFSAAQVERFQREERIVARLRHPGIVTIYEIGREGDALYYTMDLIPGKPFDPGEGDVRRRVRILEKVARAVHYAHEQGVIHRDLKPGNILVDAQGEPRLLDFGLSRSLEDAGDLTRTGAFFGTPYYMAPEQAARKSHDADARTDVYALGTVLYEAMAGTVPFPGDTVNEIVGRLLSEDPAPPPGPKDLSIICLKAMEKDPARRYPTAGAFAEDLARFQAGEPIQARPPSVLYRARRFVVRHRSRVTIAACLLTALAAWLYSLRSAPRQVLTVERVQGEVFVSTPAGRAPARPGQEVFSGQTVETAAGKSGVVLVYPDSTRLELEPDSVLQLQPGNSEKTLFLTRGRARVGVVPQREDHPLALGTPLGDVRTRGARFVVAATPTWTKLEVLEGIASLSRLNDRRSADVQAGHYAVADRQVDLSSRPIPREGLVPAQGLRLWLRADRGVLSQDSRVGRWEDQSGSGHPATQTLVPNQPLLIKDVVAGQPALEFDGNDFFALPPGFRDFTAGLTLFVFARTNSRMQPPRFLMLSTGDPKVPGKVGFGTIIGRDSLHYGVTSDGEHSLLAPDGLQLGRFQTLCFLAEPSGGVRLFRNGNLLAAGSVLPLPQAERKVNYIGRDQGPTGFKGELSELLLYDRALSEPERLQVEGYLRHKYFDAAGEAPDVRHGLRGEYFAKADLTELRLTRIDPKVDFEWDNAGPEATWPARPFSIRWTGSIEAQFSEPFTFYAPAGDGVRLYIDERPVIDVWKEGESLKEQSGSADLRAGRKYRLRLEFKVVGRPLPAVRATARLSWSSPSTPKQVIPQRALLPPDAASSK